MFVTIILFISLCLINIEALVAKTTHNIRPGHSDLNNSTESDKEDINKNFHKQIDELFLCGFQDNFKQEGMNQIKSSLDLCLKGIEKHPDSYDFLWRASRSASQYAESAKCIQINGWRKICEKWGKKGIDFGEKAILINPKRVEGYYWQCCSIGVYKDGAGLISMIREGIYQKMKRGGRKAYEIDKSYCDYGPVFGGTIFYSEPPWPLRNIDKAIAYYHEHNEKASWTWEPHVKYCYIAKFLIELKDPAYQKEAKRLLKLALSKPEQRQFYHDMAVTLLQKIE